MPNYAHAIEVSFDPQKEEFVSNLVCEDPACCKYVDSDPDGNPTCSVVAEYRTYNTQCIDASNLTGPLMVGKLPVTNVDMEQDEPYLYLKPLGE